MGICERGILTATEQRITSPANCGYGRSIQGSVKMLLKHFESTQLFTSDTKYFSSTQIQGILCQAALQQTSIEDIAEQQRKEHETDPTAETVRNAIIAHFEDFSPHEFGKHISSVFQVAVRSSLQYQKLRREPVTFCG